MSDDRRLRRMTPEERALYLAGEAIKFLPKSALKLGVTLITIPVEIIVNGVKENAAIEYKPEKK